METQFDNKITWTIKNFSSLPADKICSDNFVLSGCKWNLQAYPKGYYNANYLSLFLAVVDYASLPTGCRRHTKCRFTVVNQISNKLSQSKIRELDMWFEVNSTSWGNAKMCPLDEIHAKDSRFLVNGELKIVAEINVVETIGKLDVTEETSTIVETRNVNGFQLLPSQAKSVNRIFKRHPEIASDFRPKNPNLRTGYMGLLLSLIETMCQLPQEISKDDLFDAYAALAPMRDAGFKLDWLEKKLDEVSEKQENEGASETGLHEMEEELKDLKQKLSAMEALVEKEKGKVSPAKAPISFNDVV
ncbi:Protein RESTRICTED TEV MOVEMENT 3 [Cardamine amara subsp. amara]|uniref:Protein RESTRICTED TEV MOVEMENT 3 n=1 Tax=Cardamine amara subsp. amara TaxID=228776 RepID=A0ABD1A418_CARAN